MAVKEELTKAMTGFGYEIIQACAVTCPCSRLKFGVQSAEAFKQLGVVPTCVPWCCKLSVLCAVGCKRLQSEPCVLA